MHSSRRLNRGSGPGVVFRCMEKTGIIVALPAAILSMDARLFLELELMVTASDVVRLLDCKSLKTEFFKVP
jgi:hypothetical protein